ncbi:hypothetical protein PGTUg99_019964 [Puccinia graminis f. sp. tritici]|uniref:Uncharacterized protein n=1 Tax=Puccinia graminis f. sp. tritici TaxID=56615 RepID=A0A5B0RD03_PUCGR|nr:hypothetical protein PGTUg99_019964 [Puccinia graminis f. sp. tritici]
MYLVRQAFPQMDEPLKHHPFNQLPTAWHNRNSTFGPPSRDRTSDLKIYSLVLLGLLSGDRRRGQTCRADPWLIAEIKIVKIGPAVQKLSPLKVGPRFSLDYLRSSRYRKPLGIALRRRGQSYRDESWLSFDPKISKIRPRIPTLSHIQLNIPNLFIPIFDVEYLATNPFLSIVIADKVLALDHSFHLSPQSRQSDFSFKSYSTSKSTLD